MNDTVKSVFGQSDEDRSKLLEKELKFYSYYNLKNVKELYFVSLFKKNFIFIDRCYALLISFRYKIYENKTMFRSFFRVLQTNQGFYFNFNNFKKNDYFLNSLKNTIFSGLKYT
jgi:hypothetical protein